MFVCASAGFPTRLPSKIERRVTGWERDSGAVEDIGGVGNSSSSIRINETGQFTCVVHRIRRCAYKVLIFRFKMGR